MGGRFFVVSQNHPLMVKPATQIKGQFSSLAQIRKVSDHDMNGFTVIDNCMSTHHLFGLYFVSLSLVVLAYLY
jgi:hypothetical protein